MRLDELKADGGAAVERLADAVPGGRARRPVVVPEISETTALGAAYLAGVARELWTRGGRGRCGGEAARYEPGMSEDERETLLAEWRRAVERSRDWAQGNQDASEPGRDWSKMKPQVYKDPRPAEYFTRFHERARERPPRLGLRGGPAGADALPRVRSSGRAASTRTRCPPSGPAIVAPNHFSFLDHFFVAVYMRRKVHFMAKSQLFKRPMQFIYTHGGVFPVRRGHRDEEAFETADAILGRGDLS